MNHRIHIRAELSDAQQQDRRKDHKASKPEGDSNSEFHLFWDFLGPVFVTIALYLGISKYGVEARYIPSKSMIPGLQVHDKLLVEKLSLHGRSPLRGEIVVFNTPYSFNPEWRNRLELRRLSNGEKPLPCFIVNFPLMSLFGLANESCSAWIKRVVAVGGGQVSVNSRGQVIVNGEKVEEPYVTNYCTAEYQGMGSCQSLVATVPKDHVLVLGDNRINSTDGRSWGFLPESEIIGRAAWRFYPFNRVGSLTP